MATVCRGGTREKYRFIHRYGQALGVKYLCDWLGVSRSGYYAWGTRPASSRSSVDRQLANKIRQIHQQSRGTYGSPRVYAALKRQGIAVGKKRVERLMRAHQLRGRVVTVTRRQPGLKEFLARGENLTLKAPATTRFNQIWVSDISVPQQAA